MERSTTKLQLLDVMINKTAGKIWMNVFSKPTDSKSMCSSDKIIGGAVSEIFCFVWLDQSALLLKKKTQG